MIKSLFTIITFYEFKKIEDLEKLKNELKDFCKFNKIRGTIILAKEGINGTLAGTDKDIKEFIILLSKKRFDKIEFKFSHTKYMPFFRLKVKLKKEIVTLRSTNVDPENIKGKHIQAEDWNNFIKDENTILIDVRNDFEFKVGTFKKSINPKTKNFTEFKKFVDKNLPRFKDKKIAMFCTGGIRCEKASSYMISRGCQDINQLKGGILKYLEVIPQNQSSWVGECFVFDNRVSVVHKLKKGTYNLCHACRNPLNIKDRNSKKYVKGISCSKCYGKISIKKKQSLNERNKQIKISRSKGLYNPYLKFTANDLY
tara:strand:+ start:3081 stop:4016 length:936 start_codon:yes stop_codon:yes gene_type:complete